MHRSRLGNIVIDCQTDDLLSAARFWSAALGYPLPQDSDAGSNFIQLVTPTGDVQVIVQRVRHEARAHLDIETDSIEAEVSRLQHLGPRLCPAIRGGLSCRLRAGIGSASAVPIAAALIRGLTHGVDA